MKYRVCVNDKNFQIILGDIFPDPSKEILVESGYNRFQANILAWDRELGIRSVLLNNTPYDIEIYRNDRGGVESVKVDNEVFSVDEIQAGKVMAAQPRTELVKKGVVRAFMPGLIVRLLKSEGDSAEEGETVLYMEAMKMENALTAPRSGKLSKVPVKEGQTVLTGDLLFVVE
jgi:biotin carboxyl carrier protein